MTRKEKYEAVLLELLAEKASCGDRWSLYYDQHIAELRTAIEELGK